MDADARTIDQSKERTFRHKFNVRILVRGMHKNIHSYHDPISSRVSSKESKDEVDSCSSNRHTLQICAVELQWKVGHN